MKVKLILPSLTEAKSAFWRPIKYSLFPPLGLATLAAFLDSIDEIDLQDQHVEKLNINDSPDLVLIQVYITNARRAYSIAKHYKDTAAPVINDYHAIRCVFPVVLSIVFQNSPSKEEGNGILRCKMVIFS